MIVRIPPSRLAQPTLPTLFLRNKVVQTVLLILLFRTIVYVVNTLVGRVTKNSNNKKAEECFGEAIRFHNAQNFSSAHEQFQKALDCKPSNENLKAEICIGLASSSKNPYESLEYLTRVIHSSVLEESILTRASQQRAGVYFLVGHFPGALKDLEYALPRVKPDEKGLILAFIAKAHCGMDQHEEAKQKSREALELMPDNAYLELYTELSSLCLELNNPIQALEYLKLGLELAGSQKSLPRAVLLAERAKLYARCDRTDLALQDLGEAFECQLGPSDQSKIVLIRARIYKGAGQHDLAIPDFRRAHQSNIAQVQEVILKEVGTAAATCLEKREPAHALKYVEFGLELVGTAKSFNRCILLSQRAELYAQSSRIDPAINDLDEALECPVEGNDRSHILLMRGQLKKSSGNLDSALLDFKEAQQCQPTDPEIQQTLRQEIESATGSPPASDKDDL